MSKHTPHRIRELLDRVSRLLASAEWLDGSNPAQRSVLDYLARANRFSRSPSQVADFLCTTRGTASQTLKALERKRLVEPVRSQSDRRSVSYDLTVSGRAALDGQSRVDGVLEQLSPDETGQVETALETLVAALLENADFAAFGICRTCRFHEKTASGTRCALLNVALTHDEAGQICHEHVP